MMCLDSFELQGTAQHYDEPFFVWWIAEKSFFALSEDHATLECNIRGHITPICPAMYFIDGHPRYQSKTITGLMYLRTTWSEYISTSWLNVLLWGHGTLWKRVPPSMTKQTLSGSLADYCAVLFQMCCAKMDLFASLGSPDVSERDVGMLLKSYENISSRLLGVRSATSNNLWNKSPGSTHSIVLDNGPFVFRAIVFAWSECLKTYFNTFSVSILWITLIPTWRALWTLAAVSAVSPLTLLCILSLYIQ